MRGWVVLLAGLALVGCGSGGPKGEAVLLRLKGAKGEKHILTVQLEMTVALVETERRKEAGVQFGEQKLMAGIVREDELIDVNEGHYVWKETMKDIKAEGTGMFKEIAAAMKVTDDDDIHVSRVFDEHHRQTNEVSAEDEFPAVFPEKTIRPGDEWEEECRIYKDNLVAKLKFVRYETVNGRKVAMITTKVDAPSVKTTPQIVNWVDVETGQTLESEGSFETDNFGDKVKVVFTAKRT